jgi:hypothetical protein
VTCHTETTGYFDQKKFRAIVLRGEQSKILNRMYESETESSRGLERQHNEAICSLYSSPHTIDVIKLRRMGWTECIACMSEMHTKYLLEIILKY